MDATPLKISDLARQAGKRASAIRYYEEIGLLPRAERVSGRRRYDETSLHRLALIQRARQLGFTLAEIRELFLGFRPGVSASQRWRALSQRKMAELDELLRSIRTMQKLLNEMMTRCRCETLEQCGRGIYRSGKNAPTASGKRKACCS